MFLDGRAGGITVRRINRSRSFVYSLLWREGELLFESAIEQDAAEDKLISVLIIGLGKTGTAMLKALVWFGQMNGYRLVINAYDSDELSESRFAFQCPELLDDRYNNRFDDEGEVQCSIGIHSGVDVGSKEFADQIPQIPEATFVFVALGDDDRNVAAAADLRVCLERHAARSGGPLSSRVDEGAIAPQHFHPGSRRGPQTAQPIILAIVHDSRRAGVLDDHPSKSTGVYRIRLVGAFEDIYSYDSVFDPELENRAARWCAWTRAEGFEYSGDTAGFTRSDPAKRHSLLVGFHSLPPADQEAGIRMTERNISEYSRLMK